MRRIFGVAKEVVAKPTLDETTDKIGVRGDKMDEKIKALDMQLADFKKKMAATRPGATMEGLKRRAIQVLKQKKLYESQREQLSGQQFNMEQTRFTVDSIQDTVSTVQALKSASKEMKTAFKKNKELDINYIDKMQDDMFDMMEMSREINDAMGRSYDVPDDIDESDLMAELDGLEEDMANEAATAGKTPSYLEEEEELPSAPSREAGAAEHEQGTAIKS
ncbi:MAG: hypothetical protein WDW38_005389 [Sanguina aurantia]